VFNVAEGWAPLCRFLDVPVRSLCSRVARSSSGKWYTANNTEPASNPVHFGDRRQRGALGADYATAALPSNCVDRIANRIGTIMVIVGATATKPG
jgi:hypothetical protein